MSKIFSLIVVDLLFAVCSIAQKTPVVDNDSLKLESRKSLTTFFPAMSLENPINSGRLGLVVIGGTHENRTRISSHPDASAGVYIGLGEPEKLIGAGATINIYGLSNRFGEKNNFGEGSLNFHLNKLFLQNKLLLDVGVDNALYWGGVDQQYISYQRSFYFSTNYLFYLKPRSMYKPFSYISITGGGGNGYFRKDKNYTKGASGSFDPFFSLASPLFRGTNFIAEWNGYDIGGGISSIPYQKIPFVFTLEITDLIYGKPRIITSVAFPFNFIRSTRVNTNVPARAIGLRPFRAVRTI